MEDQGNSLVLENESKILVENDSNGVVILENAPAPISINNYEFVKSGDGMSVSEKIR